MDTMTELQVFDQAGFPEEVFKSQVAGEIERRFDVAPSIQHDDKEIGHPKSGKGI